MTSKSSGFTLIELLVVVAILGIIASIGIVSYQGYVTSAKIKSTSSIPVELLNPNQLIWSGHILVLKISILLDDDRPERSIKTSTFKFWMVLIISWSVFLDLYYWLVYIIIVGGLFTYCLDRVGLHK